MRALRNGPFGGTQTGNKNRKNRARTCTLFVSLSLALLQKKKNNITTKKKRILIHSFTSLSLSLRPATSARPRTNSYRLIYKYTYYYLRVIGEDGRGDRRRRRDAAQSPSLGRQGEKEERCEEEEKRRRRHGETKRPKRESVHILVLEKSAERTTSGRGEVGEEAARSRARSDDVGGAAAVRGGGARTTIGREDDVGEEFN